MTLARSTLAAAVLLAATATPARASTMPTLDMDPRHRLTVAGGFLDLGLDWAVADNVAVGALVGAFTGAAGRATWRLAGATDRPAVGLTLGAGVSFLDAWSPMGAPRSNLWVSPALVGSWPIGAGPDSFFWVTLRGALGPGLFLRSGDNQTALYALVNTEVAFAFRGYGEITFLGNGIAGLRMRF